MNAPVVSKAAVVDKARATVRLLQRPKRRAASTQWLAESASGSSATTWAATTGLRPGGHSGTVRQGDPHHSGDVEPDHIQPGATHRGSRRSGPTGEPHPGTRIGLEVAEPL